jgi:ACS family tartrate transporter-like MFS transporter
MNAISNLAGFGTTYVVGYIKQATGNYSLAMLPLAALSGVAALSVLILSRDRPPATLPEMNPAAAVRK